MKLPKKWVGIGVGVIIVICIIAGITSSIAAQPLKLDASVTVDDVTFDYPSEWLIEQQDTTSNNWSSKYRIVSSKENEDAIVSIKEYVSTQKTSKQVAEEWITSFGSKSYKLDTNNVETYQISGSDAYQVPLVSDGGSKRHGILLLVKLGTRYVVCSATINDGCLASFEPTIKNIIQSTHIDTINETFNVVFKNGDEVIKEEQVTNSGGGASIKAPDNLTKEGYIFNGWKLEDETLDIDVVKNGDSYTIGHITEDIVLQAEWEAAWTVTFTDGENNVLKTETVANGKSATPPSSPTRDGYTFKGWSGSYSDVTEDRTINAEWTKIPTTSEKNALESAKSYLRTVGGFSYKGLIEQLEYEKYSHSDAVYAADNCGADWNEQAAQSARSYMSFMSFSRGGLIEQLQYEGFTYEQAAYGASAVGL